MTRSNSRRASAARSSSIPRQPRLFSNTRISSTYGCPRTSDAGPGCRIHVIVVAGSCRLSAVTTGSTCTASPIALIMTMQMRRPVGASLITAPV
ncbi:MAG: hypothetical protein M3Y30_12280 [Gemmatimonadota bacterium]|nr:hypothetical protein [Gemmatimonadota bacterium]